jgi:hypothetical protein
VTRALLVAAALTVCLAAAGAARATAGPAACSTTTIGGADVWVHCGPAKASVTFSGKTHSFSGGGCGPQNALGVKGWALAVGRYTVPPAKPRARYFGVAWVGKPPKAGTYRKGEFVIAIPPGQGV